MRIFFPSIDSKTTPLRGLAAIVAFLAAFTVLWAFDRFLARKMTRKAAIAAVVFLIAANSALQGLCFYLLEVKPSWDFGAIMGASEDIAAGRAINANAWKYFQEYPYNLYPAFYIAIFRMILGGHRYAPYILNIISVTVSVAGACFLAYRLYGQRAAVLAALLCMGITPLYLYIPIVYTDTLSMPFPIWTVCVCTYIHTARPHSADKNAGKLRRHGKIKTIIFCALAGLLSAIGFLVKRVAAIGLAAFAVDWLFNRKDYNTFFMNARSVLSRAVSRVVPLAAALLVFAAAVHSAQAFLEHAGYGGIFHSDIRLPYNHWLMMGMNNINSEGGGSSGYGGFSGTDLRYTRSFKTTEMMKQANISVIRERLGQFGTGGYASFLLKKIEWSWTDGTYYAPVKLGRNPLKRTILHKFVLFSDGRANKLYLIFAQTVQAVVLSMIFAGCVSSAVKGSDKAFRLMTTMCLGLAFFLLFWETRSRYLVFLIPVLVVMAVKGMLRAFSGLDKALGKFIM
ncbi:MAG: ArnT family glycosyltransferase [Acetivibrionales bacterium]